MSEVSVYDKLLAFRIQQYEDAMGGPGRGRLVNITNGYHDLSRLWDAVALWVALTDAREAHSAP